MSESMIVEQLSSVIDDQPVDEVLVALPIDKYGPLVETIVRQCEEQGIIVRVRTKMSHLQVARSYVDELQGVPVMTIQSGPADSWQLIMKRVIDILGSAALLLALAPLFAVVAWFIRKDSPGPVFFTQERIGFNKRPFRLIKFRTMMDGADHQQAELEHLNEAAGPVFKIKSDPRVTRVGKFLRRFSIDELPQLVNVLKGDMSLVGPRPLPVRDFDRFNTQWHKRRLSVKPGMTCLWQVNGRSNVTFDHWVQMDLEYIDNWSLGLDMKILLKTIPAIMRGSGAY
jgi:exopolysaccharide biosynthesis polyprenyl glycosylphosphotransferase